MAAVPAKMETGKIVVEIVGGKSTVTRCFSKYPLKFIVPKKIGNSLADAVWVYSISYGGGIVSGDSISCGFTIGDGCTTVLTTQSSTKVYKSLGSKVSEQNLEAEIGHNSLFVVVPDPVTCFSTARYSQKQIFRIASNSSLLLVDWITSGRIETGEKWDFEMYKSINRIFAEDGQPVFIDSVLLEKGRYSPVSERMQHYQVLAMVIIMGPRLKHIQDQIQEEVKRMMSHELLHSPRKTDHFSSKPDFLTSCSAFGPKGGGGGVVVRIASTTTESVYKFLRHQLANLEPLLGAIPYRI
ncbi:urease accessory protein D [Impatiens glandulifera]|uniref:urease accessory protein D n=1 Tax=Impatiens glandulifera TaxID=253017 RepID=UPI001FB05E09|nr:urease accessory protein D [Impatiens glandulifera]